MPIGTAAVWFSWIIVWAENRKETEKKKPCECRVLKYIVV
jgi:hypothetical protein